MAEAGDVDHAAVDGVHIHGGGGGAQHGLMLGIQAQQHLAQLDDIGVERHREGDRDAAQRAVHGQVLHGLGDELGVGHDDGGFVVGLNLGGAHADAADVADLVTDTHAVAELHGALGQQNQARDKVLRDGLQAKTDAHGQRTGQQRDFLETDAHGRQRPQGRERDAHVASHGADGVACADVQLGLGQIGFHQPVLQCAEDGQACHQHDQAAQEGHGAQHGVANGQAFGQRVGHVQQAAGVAERGREGQQAQQHQADAGEGGQQHADLLHAGGLHPEPQRDAFADAAFGGAQPAKEVIGELHQQRGGQHHHGDPHHLRGDEDREIQIPDQRCNQRGQHRQVPAQPGKHQPVAGGGRAVFIAVLGGLFQVDDLLALALLLDDHQHRDDEAGIGQRNQAVQGHAADVAGAGGNVHRIEHDGEPGQARGAPGQACEFGRGLIVDVQQPPGRVFGHQ